MVFPKGLFDCKPSQDMLKNSRFRRQILSLEETLFA